jgi:hypothetical protein
MYPRHLVVYGKLFALSVYLAWLLHIRPGLETCPVPRFFGKIYLADYCSHTRGMHEGVGVMLDRV